MDNKLPILRDKHALFVDKYFEHDLNATRAAQESGYSRARAKQQGYHLLKREDIQQHIQARLKKQHDKKVLDADKIIRMLSDMAQVDPADFYGDDGRLKPLSEMPKAARQCISEIRPTPSGMVVKLEGRIKAIELVGKHLKMWSDAVNVNVEAQEGSNVQFGFVDVGDVKEDQ
jgi:phage terminase small subunit